MIRNENREKRAGGIIEGRDKETEGAKNGTMPERKRSRGKSERK